MISCYMDILSEANYQAKTEYSEKLENSEFCFFGKDGY